MIIKKVSFLIALVMLTSFSLEAKRGKRALDIDTFVELDWIGDINISPNGKWGAYVVTKKNIEDNSTTRNIWLFSVRTGNKKQMTFRDRSDSSPRWSPDNKTLGFLSDRSKSQQIWVMDIKGGEARKLTDWTAGIDDFTFSPDGEKILFTSTVYKGCSTDKCVKKKEKELEDQKHKIRVITEPIYRHGKTWFSGKISRLFEMDITSKKVRPISKEGLSVPPIGLSGYKDFTYSPDGSEIAFVTNTDEDLSRSTNNDIFVYDVKSGKTSKISESLSNDNTPVYSPDGKYIAFLTQETPGFESDKTNLAVYDRESKDITVLTEDLDRSSSEFVWTPDTKGLFFCAYDMGYREIYSVSLKHKKPKKVTYKTYNKDIHFAYGGRYLVMIRESFQSPPQIYSKDMKSGEVSKLIAHNEKALRNIKMGESQEFSFKSKDGTTIHGFFVFPPFFNAKKKYPWLLLIHGGPQGVWSTKFHPRWNNQLFAAPGYVTAAINFRGSISYGQDFTNRISKDWVGKPVEDILTGIDYLLKNNRFLSNKDYCAAGGSFGGFMVNWLEGQTDQFKCMISHAGDSDQISAFGTTEEKWFPEWEIPKTPYDNFEAYKKTSPILQAKNFKTPLLILHGEQDFRVPIEQAMEMYSAAKWADIDVKMVLFPDEGHWIWKPRNAKFWWKSIHDWMAKYLK